MEWGGVGGCSRGEVGRPPGEREKGRKKKKKSGSGGFGADKKTAAQVTSNTAQHSLQER